MTDYMQIEIIILHYTTSEYNNIIIYAGAKLMVFIDNL